LEYYATQRSVLRIKPHLRRNQKRCRHCRIFFLTEPSNINRHDLRCPFGCSESHRRREASERSSAYYRTTHGLEKKRVLNQRRYLLSYNQSFEPEAEAKGEVLPEVIGVEPIIEHVRMVTSLIEGRFVSLDEIKVMFRKKERQHSIGHRRMIDYIVGQLNKDPP